MLEHMLEKCCEPLPGRLGMTRQCVQTGSRTPESVSIHPYTHSQHQLYEKQIVFTFMIMTKILPIAFDTNLLGQV